MTRMMRMATRAFRGTPNKHMRAMQVDASAHDTHDAHGDQGVSATLNKGPETPVTR